MLRLGWHLVYYQVSDMHGSPESIRLMLQFHPMAEKEFCLAKQAVLFGFSRGGLYAVNYAAAYPDRVRSLYLDALCPGIFSCPGSGFVFNTIHNIMPDVPPENIVAMFDTVAEYM